MAQQQPPEIQAILDMITLMDRDTPVQAQATRVQEIQPLDNTSISSKNKALQNPFYGMVMNGGIGAFGVTLGALVRDRAWTQQALTILVGGALNGMILGTMGMFLPEKKRFQVSCIAIYRLLAITEVSLELTAYFTTPWVGECILAMEINYQQTIIDLLIGIVFLAAGAGLLMILKQALPHNEDQVLTPTEAYFCVNELENDITQAYARVV